MAKTAAQMANAWSTAMASPTTSQNYKAGIQATTVNPMAAAASPEAQARYAQNTAAAASSGKMANALNAVPMSTWQNNAINVGANRLSTGAQKASSKMQTFFNKWAPIYQQASQAAQALPKGGMANAMARVQASMAVLMQAAGSA